MGKRFNNAIVKKPCAAMVKGITSAKLGAPDYENALIQHAEYVKILEMCGLKIQVLESMNNFPDSTFIEDVSLCTPYCAVVTNPGAESRNGEIIEMKVILSDYYSKIEEIKFPGTVDGGDVMMVADHYYIGISDRTNHEGADQLIRILEKYNMTGSKVEMSEVLHLKTGVSYLENNNLLVSGEFVEHPYFKNFNKTIIEPTEAYAANSLWINDNVLVPKGFLNTLKKISKLGYKTIEVDVSEFRKLDGGLSCLSLRF